MDIMIGKNKSSKFALNKTVKDWLTIENVRILDTTTIEEPKLEFNFTNRDISVGELIGYNYVYIKDFGRYYFGKISIGQGNRFFLDCEVDSISSHSAAISSLTCWVKRTQSASPSECVYEDSEFPTKANSYIEKIDFSYKEANKPFRTSNDPLTDNDYCMLLIANNSTL